MDRRRFLGTLTGSLLAAPLAAGAQQAAKVPRIGVLAIATSEAGLANREAFWRGMREHGWTEGQNIVIEARSAEGQVERLASFASELVRLKVDVIVAPNDSAAVAAKNATITIPIVMVAFDDPVRSGLVASLARPGGNVTGLTFMVDVGIISKQLQLLTEVVPNLSRVALLRDPADPRATSVLTEMTRVADSLRVRVQVVDVHGPNELERAFALMTRERVDAVLVQSSGMFYTHRSPLAALVGKHRLPAMFWRRDWVAAGGLMSYGADYPDLMRRVWTYVDKILKGAQPGDLPIEQPTKFELVINLKTAKALGLTIPPSLLARADQVIE
jgi:ABC-type uncharacterized transport system substrate-binding protein